MMERRNDDMCGRKYTILLIAAIVAANFAPAYGQDYEAVRNTYKNEQAVVTSLKEQLVISNHNGKLEAVSNVAKEKVLISELAPGMYNTDYIFHSYFNKLEDHDEEALIPGKNGYKKLKIFSVKTSRSEANNIFYDDAQQTEIAFSGLTAGAVMHSNYTLSHRDIHMLPAYYFEENLKVVQSVFELTAPKYVQMKFVLKGSDTGRVVRSIQENKNTITYTFTASNLPAYRSYDDVPSSAWNTLHIVPYIASYQMPGEARTELLSDVGHLYTYFYGFIKNVNTKEDKDMAATAALLTKSDKTPKEKAAHIYQWVQQNMHYIAFEDSLEGFIPRQAADIYRRKFGDCKDMASILMAMCRSVGVDAYFTWIGTRSKPYMYNETPLPIVDNHMICAVKAGDEWILMDGTHPLIPFGAVPASLQGKEALVSIDEKNYKIITVPETDLNLNTSTDSTVMHINDKSIAGKTSIDFKGYESWELQIMLMYKKNKERDEMMRSLAMRGSNKYTQSSYKFTNEDSGNKDSRVTADFTVGDYVQRSDKEYYVNMNVRRHFDGSSVDTAGRAVPVYFDYRELQKEVVVLEVPAGFHVSYVPKEAAGALKGIWDYSIKYSTAGNKVILEKEYRVMNMCMPVKEFTANNKLVSELKKQYKESIVLTADQ